MSIASFREDRPDPHEVYRAEDHRVRHLEYRRVGRSGLLLPPLSLGLWYNFGDDRAFSEQRALLRHAFDRGITHFDLANNYGPPPGAAEETFGRMLRKDFKPYRNEIVVSTKAGWPMWLGPYGRMGSRKYLLASLDESLERLGVDYVDVFYSHRFDPDTPLEETIGALDAAVRAGKALYVGISSYSVERTAAAIEIARDLGTPLVLHQPSYSLINRWIEQDLLDVIDDAGMAASVFTPLAQGMLTDKYLDGGGNVVRAAERATFHDDFLSEDNLARLRGLDGIAKERGQTLAQLALAWVLRDPRVATAIIGVSRIEQLDENLAALDNLAFTAEELERIDQFATDGGVNLWAASSEL